MCFNELAGSLYFYFNLRPKPTMTTVCVKAPNFISIIFLSLFFFSPFAFADIKKSETAFINVSKDEARIILEKNAGNPNFEVIDVRTPTEYRSGHIKDAKLINIYEDDFVDRIRKLNRDKTYFVYCGIGFRSAKTHDLMKRLGFKKVYNLRAGIAFGFPTPPVR